MTPVRLLEQRDWYEDWYQANHLDLPPIEGMKKQMRLESVFALLSTIEFSSVLVIGCGQGRELPLFSEADVTAFDLSHRAVRFARQRLPAPKFLQADGMHLPFAANCFDLVFSSEVIEHVLQPEPMLREVVRVLRPGGHVLVTTPNWRSFFGAARWAGEKVLRRPVTSDDQPVDRWATSRSLAAMLEGAGLPVVARRGSWYFPPTGLGRKRLPDAIMARLYRLALPLERRFQRRLPGWGHILIMLARLPVAD